ncbi:MAG TPA: hypothetical protein VLL54_16875 [Pyrinomonadaceae bacterium]|nr:hypothetical protein [Pyrinomonadaceae bacterium]
MRLNRIVVALTFALLAAFAVPIQAHPPTGIVVDHAGNIYFSDLETIWKFDLNNKLSIFRQGVSGRHVHELAIDEQDNIYGGDYSYESAKFISAIWKMSPDGKFEYLLEPTANPPAGLSIWRDREGNTYTVDQNNHTKTQTLLLRRAPDGKVTTVAGGAYGYADGKGTAARFSSVGNIGFGPEGDLFVTDGATVRRVSRDGTVVTVANHLDARTTEDKPLVFVDGGQNLTGIAVDASRNAYVADSNNRRLLKIDAAGKVSVLLRTDPPFFPNGVFVGRNGEIYVLEVGLALPSSWSGPRVRRITPAGENTILVTIGAENRNASSTSPAFQPAAPPSVKGSKLISPGTLKYGAVIIGAIVLGTCAMIWKRRKRS